MYWVYVLKSSLTDKRYVGHTSNLEDRLCRHNKGEVRFTKRFRPWFVAYKESFKSRSQAVIRERQLKAGQGRKFLEKAI